MGLGQNLQFLRKRENLTQEQLAEALDVSRQSVSKWESDATFPETDKLIQLAELFHCSLDDLMRKDISTQYVEDKNHYDQFMDQFSKRTTLGVGLILSGLTLMTFITAIVPPIQGIDIEGLASIIFFLFVIASAAILIVSGLQHEHYVKKYPYIENFYTEEEKEAFHKKFIVMITSGVVIILFAIIISIGLETFISSDHMLYNAVDFDMLTGSLFLFFITIAVVLFVYAGTQESKYNITHYNLMNDPNSLTHKNDKKIGLICGCIMMAATMIFLACGFIWDLWKSAWVVYPIFGISCGIVATIINRNNEEEK